MFEAAPLVVEAPSDVTTLVDAAERACAAWGLPAPALVRVGSNGVFTAGDVILRVGVATAPMGVALAFAERVSALGVRAARPARRDWLEFPGNLSVTAWQRIDFDAGAAVDWERVGAMIQVVHSIDPGTVDHPLPFCGDFPWWDLGRLLGAASHDPDAHRLLTEVVERHRWWYASARGGALTLCHGDVHPGNVLVATDGPVLIDWDLLCVGPPEFDHAALATQTERWGGAPGIYEAFATGCGDFIDPAMLDAISELRLVAATLMRLRRAQSDPAAAPEAERRMRYWHGDPAAPVWQAQ